MDLLNFRKFPVCSSRPVPFSSRKICQADAACLSHLPLPCHTSKRNIQKTWTCAFRNYAGYPYIRMVAIQIKKFIHPHSFAFNGLTVALTQVNISMLIFGGKSSLGFRILMRRRAAPAKTGTGIHFPRTYQSGAEYWCRTVLVILKAPRLHCGARKG